MHRTFRNALNADDWKKLWSDIQLKARRIDDGIRGQIGLKTLDMWKKIGSIETSTERIQSLQQDTMKTLEDLDRRQLLQSLKITGNAIFDSRQTSSMEVPCLPGTQLSVLETIQDWIENGDGSMVFWLEGMARTGKTSISMTVATAMKEGKPLTNQRDAPIKAFLGASFFFNQGDATRNSTVELFTTIASCLSSIFPNHGSPILQAIRENHGIETKSPQEQFRKLIADPLASPDKNTFMPTQLLVVVDALDECDDNDAEVFLCMLQVLGSLRQIRLCFFVTSRREGHVSLSFKNLPRHLYTSVRLEKVESSPSKDGDIAFYLSKTLHGMSAKYGIKDGGISNADIKKLAEKSDGLFIYVVTACRFLSGSDSSNKRLRDIRLSLILDGHLVTLSLSGELQSLNWDVEGCKFKPTWDFRIEDAGGQEAIVNLDGPTAGAHDTSEYQLWDLEKRTKVKTILVPAISHIEFSPANDFFSIEYALGNESKLFCCSNGQEVKDCDLDGWSSLTFHPTESAFAVRSQGGNNIELWEALPRVKRFSLQGTQGHSVKSLVVSETKIAALSSRFECSTIDIWNFITGQKLYSHTIGLSGRAVSFNISTDETCLESNRGRIPLPSQDTTTGSPSREWEGIQNSLYVLHEWIIQGHERLLWLPAEYRPRTVQTRNIDVQGGMIALAHKSNSAVFIGISLERTPIAEIYMKWTVRNCHQQLDTYINHHTIW